MRKLKLTSMLFIFLLANSLNAFSTEVCKVSMMGRVCFEEGSPEATAAHMKGDAVAESLANKKKAVATDNSPKKVAEK